MHNERTNDDDYGGNYIVHWILPEENSFTTIFHTHAYMTDKGGWLDFASQAKVICTNLGKMMMMMAFATRLSVQPCVPALYKLSEDFFERTWYYYYEVKES